MNTETQNWYSKLTIEQRKIADELQRLVLSNGQHLREELKWNQPCFFGKSMVCYIQKAKGHVSLGFGNGAKLADPDGRLEGSGGQLRHVKVHLGTEVDRLALADFVKGAIALDKRG